MAEERENVARGRLERIAALEEAGEAREEEFAAERAEVEERIETLRAELQKAKAGVAEAAMVEKEGQKVGDMRVKCIVRAGAEGEGGPQAEAAASTAGSTESAVDARGPPSVEAEDSTRSKAHDFMSRLVDRAIEEDKVADKEDGDDGVTNTITTTDDASTIITHQATDAAQTTKIHR